MESLEACAGPPAIYLFLLAEMPKNFSISTQSPPVRAKVLANLGKSWQIVDKLY
jgi:hypothetical protein